jgi:uroporphyrinogen decarboxylase
MKPLERVVTTLGHKEPDKVPIFIFLTVHGASAIGKSFSEYYATGSHVANGQLKLQARFRHDCLYPFFYAAVEHEAFGGTVLHQSSGPPVAGKPIFKTAEDLLATELPSPQCEAFLRIVDAQQILYEAKGSELPIINAVIAPLSLPVMLMGFESWMECIVTQPNTAREVVSYLSRYTVPLANHLFENGATALAYFNPLAATHMLSLQQYEDISLETCTDFYKRVKGPTVYALAGGKCEDLLPFLTERINVPGVMVSRMDNLSHIKENWGTKTNLIGNLDNVSLQSFSPSETEMEVRRCVEEGGVNGGFIISDHHGDLPLHVPDEVLIALINARNKWGRY